MTVLDRTGKVIEVGTIVQGQAINVKRWIVGPVVELSAGEAAADLTVAHAVPSNDREKHPLGAAIATDFMRAADCEVVG